MDVRKIATVAVIINPTTPGRNPRKMFSTMGSFFPLKMKYASVIIMRVCGITLPIVAITAPGNPAIFVPTKVAAFIAIGPGVI